ncbi:DUF5675 family protein [Flagellimonas marina]|uniref:DUF5675 family protein n=1 Tax=Flagellimonas marina TaxID=1775168 RepID=A0ABV8PR48_9FLAO
MKLTLTLTMLILAGILSAHAQVTPAEKQALQDLYNATDGPNWATETDNYFVDDWDFSGNVTSDWYGVTVQNGHVVELDLEYNELTGTIPSSIGDLVHLTYLNLSVNNLVGSIPSEIGNLTLLQILDLYNNDFSGNLPSTLGNLTDLTNLNLSGNELSGAIPPELGNLVNLIHLYIYYSGLEGSIPPELGNLSNLQNLSIYGNEFSGVIPPELGNLTNLTRLNLSNNFFNGSIPPELGNLTNLTHLDIINTTINGPLPAELGDLSNLLWLDLSNNNLNGTLPSELGNLSSLQWLQLSNNVLNGAIPSELQNLANLRYLYVDNNMLNGPLPAELGNLSNLQYLDLSNNEIDGSIPPELGNMTALGTLNIANNELSGAIPPELSNLPLGSLNLQNNNLSGSIPPELGNFPWLENLFLNNNLFSGPIPPELGNLTGLMVLSLQNNQLSGFIPSELGNLSGLVVLYLQNNELTGEIPPELGDLYIYYFDVSNNELSGVIPVELGNLTNLRLLKLNNNSLNGTIPTEFGNLTDLVELRLDYNELVGSIPSELGNISNMENLYLNDNDLSSDIPMEIVDNTYASIYVENNLFDFGNLEYTYQNAFEHIFTYTPQQKTDQPQALQVIEGEDIVLSTAISGSQNHYVWYKDGQPINGAPDAPDYTLVGATQQDAGTYHCEMTSDIVANLTLIRNDIVLEVSESQEQPEEENWNIITVWDYDMDTNLKANNRRYYNELGKHVQTQSWDAVTQAIWGQATLYDYQGRPALSTLSAPLPGQTEFQYHHTFITDDAGDVYDAKDFDHDPFTPDRVLDHGPLGQYYNGLTSHQYQDVTQYPFVRTVFSDLNPDTPRATVGGNKTDTDGKNGITEADQWPQAYTFTMPATDELSLDVAFNDVAYTGIQTLKTVTRDVHGNENVVFTDTDGKLLATARSGDQGVVSPQMNLPIGAQGWVDVHIPQGVTGISMGDQGGVTVYNLITDAVEQTPMANLPPGFYRVAVNDLENYTPNSLSVRYHVTYYDYSLNEYDEANRLVASYQPVTDGNGDKLVTTYTYNTLGQLVSTTSPDEGTANFKYRNDGQIRYSQNSEQALVGEVSYTDYDTFGRPVESGVLLNVFFATLDPDAPLPQANKKETVATVYDFLDDDDHDFLNNLDPNYQHPSFLAGNVAKTSNAQSTTYYSYDGYGRVQWLVQHIDGLGTKTLDYAYEPLTGMVQKVTYQKGEADQFIHSYTYNQRDQLVQVQTSVDDNTFALQAEYTYNDAGTLVRTELADGAQGLDYVYTLAGQLKSINHPTLSPSEDPGGDLNDLFGMQLDYHLGDYQRTQNTNITTAPQGTDQLNGNIKGIRWQTATQGSKESQYVYSYDRNNWLIAADFDPDDKNNKEYDLESLTYDANGNLQSLVRNKNEENNSTAMDDLSYHYNEDKPNQLLWVNDVEGDVPNADDIGGQAQGNYQYNSIGQLTHDNSQQITYIYTTSGLVAEVQRNGKPLVKFFYNDRNHRVKKETYENGLLMATTYYVRDVAGSVMAIYSDFSGEMQLAEQPIYGAGRVGVAYNGMNDEKTYVYELTDHLGNVRAVFTKNNNDANLEGYTDYYPFGMPMPNRTLLGPEGYRYAFQGQEKDPETGKEAFELRLWDSRIGRWLTIDPFRQFANPYLGMGNSPIKFIDPDGGTCVDSQGNAIPCPNGYEQFNGPTPEMFEVWDDGTVFELTAPGVDVTHYTLNITRDVETVNSTTSTFDFGNGLVTGFFLEPPGPDTFERNQDRRIPEGIFNIRDHNGNRFQNVFNIYNDGVPQDRFILIHGGNTADDTEGCLLPGCTRLTDKVKGSQTKLRELRTVINAVGVQNVTVRIQSNYHDYINIIQLRN